MSLNSPGIDLGPKPTCADLDEGKGKPTAQLAFTCPGPGTFPPTTRLGRPPAPLYLPLPGPGQEAYLSPAGNGIHGRPSHIDWPRRYLSEEGSSTSLLGGSCNPRHQQGKIGSAFIKPLPCPLVTSPLCRFLLLEECPPWLVGTGSCSGFIPFILYTKKPGAQH